MEHDTPGEVYAVRSPGSTVDGPGWQLRVVPNKFPAVRPLLDATPAESIGLFEGFPGHGHHEVVIECPFHEANPTELPGPAFAAVFRAYRERLAALSADRRCAAVAVFKNVGAEAGASLAHLHSQIVATPVVPDGLRQELDGAAAYYRRTGQCVFCEMIAEERVLGERIVLDTGRYVALVPYAGRFAYETWVLPAHHTAHYEASADEAVVELAGVMQQLLRKLDHVLGLPAYNYYLHTAPPGSSQAASYHWHFEILPRTARPAGFEWGSGCFINAVAPERAAADLRHAPG